MSRVLNTDDMTMQVRFTTHCPKCGMMYTIESSLLVPIPGVFKTYVEAMRKNLEAAPRKCCGHRLPTIGKEWEVVWL